MKDNRWLSLIVLCTGFLLIVVDMTIVNVALPSIQRDLGFSQAGLAWVINGYLVAFGGLLLLAGRLGDLLGRKRVYLTGLGLFVAASVFCGLSVNQPMLIAARFIQGIGGATSSAVVLAMIVTLFPRPEEQARAFGIFSFIASAGAALGLIAGGLITQAVSWHWIFFVNVPIGMLTAIAAVKVLQADTGIGAGRRADVLGAVLVTGGLMIAVYTIVESTAYGLLSPHTLVFAGLAVALLVGFVIRQIAAPNPILPLRIFASRQLTAANIVQALMSSAFLGFFFLGSLDLEHVLGYGPMAIGLAFLPVALVMAVFSIRLSAQLIGRFGPVRILFAGQAVIGVALMALALGPVNANYAIHLLVPLALLGLGGGLSFPSLAMLAMSDVGPDDAGLASGILNTSGQVGGALGLAVLATVAGTWTQSLLSHGTSGTVALAGGLHLAWMVGAGTIVATLFIAATSLRGASMRSTEVRSEVEAVA